MFLDQTATYSYAQEGEDRILMKYFEQQQDGFYVDIGAHHPTRFSNTYLFYQKGWRGINVDAMPGAMERFKRKRPEDINIEAAVSDTPATLDFYIFNDFALNTLSESLAKERHNPAKNHLFKEKKTVHTVTITQLLDQYLPAGKAIDCMSVDIEGYDLQALRSLDFIKYRPKLILVELYEQDFATSDMYQFLASQGYSLTAKAYYTCFFKDNSIQL